MIRCGKARLRFLGILTAIATIATACVFAAVKPGAVTAPPQQYRSLVIGEIESEKLSPELKEKFVTALREKLAAANVFETVAVSAQGEAPAPSVRLTGTITEFNKGNAALRVLVGFGAGRARVEGAFKLADDEQDLARFSVRRTYAGGLGIGGAGFVSTESLLDRLATTTAESVQRWMRGESLE